MKQKQLIDLENKLTVTKGKSWREWGRDKLGVWDWINNTVLLWSTGNCIQYPVTNRSGKECEKEYVCIQRLESLCCASETDASL